MKIIPPRWADKKGRYDPYFSTVKLVLRWKTSANGKKNKGNVSWKSQQRWIFKTNQNIPQFLDFVMGIFGGDWNAGCSGEIILAKRFELRRWESEAVVGKSEHCVGLVFPFGFVGQELSRLEDIVLSKPNWLKLSSSSSCRRRHCSALDIVRDKQLPDISPVMVLGHAWDRQRLELSLPKPRRFDLFGVNSIPNPCERGSHALSRMELARRKRRIGDPRQKSGLTGDSSTITA